MIRSVLMALHRFLHKPGRVLVWCFILSFFGLAFDGSWLRLWSLYREEHGLFSGLATARAQTAQMRAQIEKAKDPHSIERDARDRFDLVDADDLLFVFTRDE